MVHHPEEILPPLQGQREWKAGLPASEEQRERGVEVGPLSEEPWAPQPYKEFEGTQERSFLLAGLGRACLLHLESWSQCTVEAVGQNQFQEEP